MWKKREGVEGSGYARVALAILAWICSVQPGAGLEHQGRDFIIGVLPILDEHGPAIPEIQVSSEQGAHVTVEYPVNAPVFSRTVWVPPQTLLTVQVPREASQDWVAGTVMNNAIHVFTSDPQPARFSAVLVGRASFLSGAGTMIPTFELGTEYFPMMPISHFAKPNSHFLVIATQNGTTVTITPTADLVGGYPSGVPFNVLLQAGEAFFAKGDIFFAPYELTGTSVLSTHPISVVAGDRCAIVPLTTVDCDSFFEVSMPTHHWGTSVMVAPLPERPAGAVYRILSASNGNSITHNGVPLTVLNRGEFFETAELPGPQAFDGTAPIWVVQFLTGGMSIPSEFGDPAMATVRPIEHYGRRHRVSTVARGQMFRFWLNLIARDSDVGIGAIVLDGVPMPASAFTGIPGTDHAYASVEVQAGVHVSESRAPHTVTVLGMKPYDSTMHSTINHWTDHFLCYPDSQPTNPYGIDVNLKTRYVDQIYNVRRSVRRMCAPADKRLEGIADRDIHYRQYRLSRGAQRVRENGVRVVNQFGELTLNLRGGLWLLMPALKTHKPAPPPVAPDPNDHDVDPMLCMNVRITPGTPGFAGNFQVLAVDQFSPDHDLTVRRPYRFCVPVDIDGAGVKRPDDNLLCYRVTGPAFNRAPVTLADPFLTTDAVVFRPRELCVPTRIVESCCEWRNTRCRIGGADAGPCDSAALLAQCTGAGGLCESRACQTECGNGTIEEWCCEECDDGTRLDGDGCSARCKVQPCCVPQPLRCINDTDVPCETSLDCEQAGVGGDCAGFDCASLCQNGIREEWCCEECDDGNPFEADSCLPNCKVGYSSCVEVPTRCSNDLSIMCYTDADCPSDGMCESYHCPSLCGDGKVDDFCCEECDDGTNLDGDGCSPTCEIQECCIVQPQRCSGDELVPCDEDSDCAIVGGGCQTMECGTQCGDGEIQNYCCELCDDGEVCYGDGELDP